MEGVRVGVRGRTDGGRQAGRQAGREAGRQEGREAGRKEGGERSVLLSLSVILSFHIISFLKSVRSDELTNNITEIKFDDYESVSESYEVGGIMTNLVRTFLLD